MVSVKKFSTTALGHGGTIADGGGEITQESRAP